MAGRARHSLIRAVAIAPLGLVSLAACTSDPSPDTVNGFADAADEPAGTEGVDDELANTASDDVPDGREAGEEGAAFGVEPADESAAARAREIRAEDDQRQHAVDGTPLDTREQLEQFLAETEPSFEAALEGGTERTNGNRPEIDVVVVDTFTAGGHDLAWPFYAACPSYAGDPPLTGIAWHIDLDEDALVYYSPVHESNIC